MLHRCWPIGRVKLSPLPDQRQPRHLPLQIGSEFDQFCAAVAPWKLGICSRKRCLVRAKPSNFASESGTPALARRIRDLATFGRVEDAIEPLAVFGERAFRFSDERLRVGVTEKVCQLGQLPVVVRQLMSAS
jgi:hypothetical protein